MMRAPDFLPIEFVIVGGGISGLTSAISLARVGHHVTLLDEGDNFYEGDDVNLDNVQTPLAAGCRIPANNTKILFRWGMEERLQDVSILSREAYFMSYETGKYIGGHALDDDTVEEVGGEFLLIHYADFRIALLKFAQDLGVTIRINTKATAVDLKSDRPSVTTNKGETLTADVIVGCDGCMGLTRSMLIGNKERMAHLGKALTAIIIDDSKLGEDPELKPLLDRKGQLSIWASGDRGVMGYAVGGNRHCLQLWSPQQPAPDGTPIIKLAMTQEEINAALEGAEPRLRKMAEAATFACSVPVTEQPHLEDWIHPDGPLIVIGEGAHPLPPASLYAITMATGDGFVLGRIFSHISRKEQIPFLLNAVQEIRQARLEMVMKIASENAFALSLPPGAEDLLEKERAARGELPETAKKLQGDTIPLLQEALEKIYMYDPEDSVDAWWLQWGKMVDRASASLAYDIKLDAL